MSSKQQDDAIGAIAVLVMAGAVLYGMYWAVMQIVPYAKKLSLLDGRPWWLVPLALLTAAILIFCCIAIFHLPRRRPRQRVISVPGFINRPLIKSSVLLIVPAATFFTLPGSFDAIAGVVTRTYNYASETIAAEGEHDTRSTNDSPKPLVAGQRDAVTLRSTNDVDSFVEDDNPNAAQEKEYQSALEKLRERYEHPTDREFIREHAALALKHKKPQEALEAYLVLTTLYPIDRLFAYHERAEIFYHDLRNPQAALVEADRYLAIRSDKTVRRLRGCIHYTLGNLEQSAADFVATQSWSDAELVYYKIGDHRSAFRMDWRQNLKPLATPRSVLFVIWHFAVTDREKHLALARIADNENPELATARRIHNLIETAKPYIDQLGLPPVTTTDHINYTNACASANIKPWLPFTVWAAALAAEGHYDAAEKFAGDALDFADELQAAETKRHIAAYAQQTPWRTKDFAKVLYDLGTDRNCPRDCTTTDP